MQFPSPARLLWHVIRPDVDVRRPEGRRARFLAVVLLALFGLIGLTIAEVLLVGEGEDAHGRLVYAVLMSALLVLLGGAYLLNYHGHYEAAAGITVGCSILGPWGAALFDPNILHGDYIPLVYVSLSLFLAAILLRVRATVAIAVIQLAGLLSLTPFLERPVPVNWPSLIAYIVFTSALSIVSTVLSRADIDQIARQNAQLAESASALREQSNRDPLTGLYNRRFMVEVLERELAEAGRDGRPVGVIIADLDYFKPYNDTYGHLEGDALLRLVSSALRTHIRKTDYVCRYGGDEFVLILPGATLEATRKRADRLREEVYQIEVENQAELPQVVTVSMGVAVFPEDGRTMDELLRAADDGLYRAKREGRDRVASPGSPGTRSQG